MATIKDIAVKCNVSTSTVSRALKNSDSISKETKDLIKKAAEELDFRPRSYKSSAQIVKNGNKIVALLLNVKHQPVASKLIRSITETLASYGYTLAVFDTFDDPNIELSTLDKIRSSVNGIIVEPIDDRDSYNIEFLKEINKKIPVVSIVRNNSISGISSVISNSFDIFAGGIQTLIDNGHKNIALLVSNLAHKTSFEKLNAYNETLKKNILPIKSEYIVYTKFDEEESKTKTKELLTKHPEITALVTSNSGISRGALLAFGELGLSVPDDISIMAYGNDILFSYPGINITSIEDKHEEMGSYAANLIANKLENYKYNKRIEPTRIELEPTLHLRGSEVFPKNRLKQQKTKNKNTKA